MATGKSDDELIQHDNKMRIWTRSGKFRKVENPELRDYGLVTKHDADASDNIYGLVDHDLNGTDNIMTRMTDQ